MAAPKGNQFWKLNPNPGRKRKFKSAKEIWDLAVDYFEWVQANPIVVRDKGNKIRAKHPRPFTLQGLWTHIGCTKTTWYRYAEMPEDEPNAEAFREICEQIDNIIFDQTFSGAAVGVFQHQLIAKKLGLESKVDVTTKGGALPANEWHMHPVSSNKRNYPDPDGQN